MNVLVVEDNDLIAMQLEMMLRDSVTGEVQMVSTVAAALAALNERTVDLAILDIQLGDENGLVVAERCAADRVPVILATGFADMLLPVTYANEQLLKKPYSMLGLQHAISRAMSRSAAKGR